MEQELDWVRVFYVIRMQAEGLMVIKKSQEEPPCRRSHPFLPCGYVDHAWAASRTVEELDAVAGKPYPGKKQHDTWDDEDKAGYQLYL